MIQVENEVGMHGDSRDRSPAANKAFAGPVPKELMDYLQAHKDTLIPEFRQVWEAAGFKTSGTWEEVFGKSTVTDGYLHGLEPWRATSAGWPRRAKPNTPCRCSERGAVRHWDGAPNPHERRPPVGPRDGRLESRGAANRYLSPDIYGEGDFVAFCAKYTQSGNPLFIPETGERADGAARALYAFGRHDAIGFSPFGIDRPDRLGNRPDLTGVYDLLSQWRR